METIHSINLIVSNPQVRGGRPCIAGTGIRVSDVVMARLFQRQVPDEIATGYALSLAQVYAALAYYYEHKDEIDKDIKKQIDLGEEQKKNVSAASPRFYLDENVQIVIAQQLQVHGIEVVTARDLYTLADSDVNHLKRATEMGFVLCTHDSDYVVLATSGIQHAGSAKGLQHKHSIGDWVHRLELIHAVYISEDMKNRVEYL